ncbi:MAG TPA: SiaB family protein kinase [Bacteroidales bacterium]|nr:SiaB family protein kinase [Bacteroidales bacterium]
MLTEITNKNIKLAYKGPFYIDILSELGSYLRMMYKSKPTTCTKLYRLFFELTQNVAKYSMETSNVNIYKYSGVGSFMVEENGQQVFIKTSNLIKNEDGPILTKYCSDINRMTKEQLRLYRGVRRKPQPEAKDTGAYIGIIQIGIISQNEIECVLESISDKHSIFTICAKVNIE